jgi:hypothetical protein
MRSIRNECGWCSADWPTRDQAGCEASWHVYEEHRATWVSIVGSDRPPIDPDPRIRRRQ